MKKTPDAFDGKTVYLKPPPGLHCRHIATHRGNFYVPVDELEPMPAPIPVPIDVQPEPLALAPPVEPVPIPVSLSMQQVLPPAPGSYVQTLLAKLPDEPWGDEERRETAKGRVRDAVLTASRVTVDDQMRYELACQALNKNMRAMELFEPEAKTLGQSIEALASRIYTERRTRERRMMHAHAVLAGISTQIDRASGDRIEAIADEGVREIEAQQ